MRWRCKFLCILSKCHSPHLLADWSKLLNLLSLCVCAKKRVDTDDDDDCGGTCEWASEKERERELSTSKYNKNEIKRKSENEEEKIKSNANINCGFKIDSFTVLSCRGVFTWKRDKSHSSQLTRTLLLFILTTFLCLKKSSNTWHCQQSAAAASAFN